MVVELVVAGISLVVVFVCYKVVLMAVVTGKEKILVAEGWNP